MPPPTRHFSVYSKCNSSSLDQLSSRKLKCNLPVHLHCGLYMVCTMFGGLPAGVSNNNVCRLNDSERHRRGARVSTVWAQNYNEVMSEEGRERGRDEEKGAEVFLYSVRLSDFSQSFSWMSRKKNRMRESQWEREEKREEREKRVDNNSRSRRAGGTEGDRDGVRQGKMSHSKCVYLSEWAKARFALCRSWHMNHSPGNLLLLCHWKGDEQNWKWFCVVLSVFDRHAERHSPLILSKLPTRLI